MFIYYIVLNKSIIYINKGAKMDSNNFINCLSDLYKNRIKQVYLNLKKEDVESDGIVVFGAGDHGKLVTDALLTQNIKPDWIVDSNQALAGRDIFGIPIRPLSSLNELKNQFIILGSSYIASMIDVCNKFGIKKWILPAAINNFCIFVGQFGNYENIDKKFNHILSIFSSLEDKLSKDIYFSYFKFHLTFELDLFNYYDPDIYFPQIQLNEIDYRHFVDAGAFTGDTLESWIKFYKPQDRSVPYSYFAFEPGVDQFAKLQAYVNSLPQNLNQNIILENCALGGKEESLALRSTGHLSNLLMTPGPGESKEITLVKRLDNAIADRPVTIVKADVEGFELPLLEGARETIMRNSPTLAISVYHNFEDIWEIPLWIKDLNLNYKFYLRHHTPVYSDVVLYAIPSR
jgi:FkbM family methyltransferase